MTSEKPFRTDETAPSDADRAAWNAVWESGWLTPLPETNARIWRCVTAALDAYKEATK